jgi:DUF2075 family protein
MLVYTGTKCSFIDDTDNDSIADKIKEAVLKKLGHRVAENEFFSWVNSMVYMYKVLNDETIPNDCGVAIEYSIPMTSKRVDFILSGYDQDSNPHANIIELKQWQFATPIPSQDDILEVETALGHGLRKTTHPSYQAWSYAQTIQNFNESVEKRSITLHPCAYLHNYKAKKHDPIRSEQYEEITELAPLFARGEVPALRDFLKSNIVLGDEQAILEMIDHGRIRPSKSLQDSLASMLDGNEEFVLIDDQKVVYEEALFLARKSIEDGQKRVYIVEGGPGTGKSVVAINLLVQLIQDRLTTQYVSKNAAPRNVYSSLLRGRRSKTNIDALFRGSGQFTDSTENAIDVAICDEAHRLNKKSGLYGNLGENQIKEIINASQFSVFFIDESQRVTLADIGSVQEIERFAHLFGAEISYNILQSQFRCNGSDGYLAWLDDVLEIHETANPDLEDINYEFVVVDSPQDLENTIRKHNIRNKSRILAGYCWNWRNGSSRRDTDHHDIEIGDWGISWNLDNTSTYAIDEGSINEAGCIHTTQGLEFDYVGVIIGEDLRFEDGNIITDYTKRAKTDSSLKGIKKMEKEDPEKAHRIADELIKNTYRTLMTRGMKGCFVYCVDKALGDHLGQRTKGRNSYHYLNGGNEAGVWPSATGGAS